MLRNVAIIVGTLSFVYVQPIHADGMIGGSHETSPKFGDDVSNSAIVPSRPNSNAHHMVVQILTNPTDLQLAERWIDWLQYGIDISGKNPRKKRELISGLAVSSALLTLWSATVLDFMTKYSLRTPPEEIEKLPKIRIFRRDYSDFGGRDWRVGKSYYVT